MAYRGTRVSDLPPLLPAGVHSLSMARLSYLGVERFPFSVSRPAIMKGFQSIACDLVGAGVQTDLIVDGSFLTTEIEPDDIDFAVCVTPEFYLSCNPAQKRLLHWSRDDFSIKE